MKSNWFKSMVSVGCVMLGAVAGQQGEASAENLLLSNGWKVQSSAKIKAKGELLSTTQAHTDGWYEANVPSTVMGTLTRNGLYTDVLEGMNYQTIDKSLFDATWWYRKEFDLPELKKGQHVALVFDGLSYRANVFLNGRLIVSRDSLYGTFRQFNLDVTAVAGKKNVLAVELSRAQPGEPNIGFVDWNPRPADESMGIYREVRVVVTHEVAMTHPAVRSKVNTATLNEAWLTVETCLTNQTDKAVEGVLKGTLEGQCFSLPVKLAANESRVVKLTPQEVALLHLKNPRLWWCYTMGKPEMYALNLEFVVNNQVSDASLVNFGVREIKEYFTKEGYRGFMLNGKKVLITSAGWTDDIFLRDTPQTNELQVQYVRDMNLNSIRFENIWGTSQNIYDLCDRYGLLALVGWSCHWEWENYLGTPCDDFGGIKSEQDMDLIARSLNDQVLWLRNHPSIIAWYVGSDMVPRPALEKRYLAYLSQIDDRPYVAAAKELTSELTGPTGMKMAGPYEYVAPNYWYSEKAPGGAFGFNTETGIGAQLPVIESLRKMIPADKLWPLSEVWDYHCTTSATDMNSLKVLKETIDKRYGEAKDLNDFLCKADWLNYEGTRAMFEAFRVNVPRTTGIVQWMLNSAWPSLYWQLYDYYHIPTAAYYGVKKANQPQQLIYNEVDRSVYAVNEGLKPMRVSAKLAVYALDGTSLVAKDTVIVLEPNAVVKAFDVPVVKANAFLALELEQDGKRVADNLYGLSADADEYDWAQTTWVRTPLTKLADFKGLSAMQPATYSAQAAVKKADGQTVVEVELANQTSQPAFLIRLALKNAQGELIYPIFWEDNYLSLLPNGKRTLTCIVPETTLKAGQVVLEISGWNVEAKKIELNF
ncbi:MAG: glycoside hydrolase family 2 [Bacteroidia bacterium]|nr:glycoside hydrolase family 2 [Bacteroidia bacterium]